MEKQHETKYKFHLDQQQQLLNFMFLIKLIGPTLK